jgi:hypothetical protein
MSIVRCRIVYRIRNINRVRIVDRSGIANQPIIPGIVPGIVPGKTWRGPDDGVISIVVTTEIPGAERKINVKMPTGITVIIIVWMQPGIRIMYNIFYSLYIVSI